MLVYRGKRICQIKKEKINRMPQKSKAKVQKEKLCKVMLSYKPTARDVKVAIFELLPPLALQLPPLEDVVFA